MSARRPMFGSLACRLHNMRESGKADEAAALLAAHNQIRRAFGQPDYDEAEHWTDCPMDGLIACPADALIDRVVARTARAA